MTSPRPRLHLSGLALLLLVSAACQASEEQQRIAPTPTSIVRAGELYTCSNGAEGCRVTYEIGPVTRLDDTLRIEFRVSLDGPSGGTTSWTNDTEMHEDLQGRGEPGIGLSPASDSSVFYALVDAGGIAATDVTLVAPVSYQGFWVFAVPEPPGTELLLSYPDFIDRPAPIVVPE